MHGSEKYDFLHVMKGEELDKNSIYRERFLLTEGTNLKEIY